MKAAARAPFWRRQLILLPVGALLVVAALLFGLQWSGILGKQSTAELDDQSILVAAVPLTHFEKASPGRTRFGRLQWRGGLVLTSASPFFGGWSGLVTERAGDRLLAVSDTGVWLTGRLRYEGVRPAGLADVRLGALRASTGQALGRSRDRDSEGIAVIAGSLAGGEILVSFEQNHRIWRFPVDGKGLGPSRGAIALPPDARRMAFNRSLEAICVLQAGAKGTTVVLAERLLTRAGNLGGWLHPPVEPGGQAPAAITAAGWRPVAIRQIDGYDITDCAGAPDGSVLLLERRFRPTYGDPVTGVKMRLRQITEAELLSGTPITGETLLEADRRYEIDNMEGVAAHADANGRTIVTLISDDNFNRFLQRTVLLQFALDDGTGSPSSER